MSHDAARRPDDQIDGAELSSTRVSPSAGESAVIASGADVSAGASIDEHLAEVNEGS